MNKPFFIKLLFIKIFFLLTISILPADHRKREASSTSELDYVAKKPMLSREKKSTPVEYEKEPEKLSKHITPRYAQLIFNGKESIDAVSAALLAETADACISLYKIDAYFDEAQKIINPLLKSFESKRGHHLALKVLFDQHAIENNPKKNIPLINALRSYNSVVKKGKTGTLAHQLHHKIYLFRNAYAGNPVCFIGSHNPTKHSLDKQDNTMIMISDDSVYEQLYAYFMNIFDHYTDEIETGLYAPLTARLIEDISTSELKLDENIFNQSPELDDATTFEVLENSLEKTTEQKISDRVTEIIMEEDKEIYLMLNQLSHQKIVTALLTQAYKGVSINIILDIGGFRPNNTCSHYPFHLSMNKLMSAFAHLENCNLGIITAINQDSWHILHDKTIACNNKGKGLIVVGSWNATGNSSSNSCEVSVVCANNTKIFEEIKSKFKKLSSVENPHFKPIDQAIQAIDILNPEKIKLTISTHLAAVNNAQTRERYKINGWDNTSISD